KTAMTATIPPKPAPPARATPPPIPVAAAAPPPPPPPAPPPTPSAAAVGAMQAATATTPPKKQSPKRSAPMSDLEKVLKSVSGLRGVARSGPSGVEEFTGQLDAESVCAVAAMCEQHLRRIEELMGCGDLGSWALTTTSAGFYVHHSKEGFVAIV